MLFSRRSYIIVVSVISRRADPKARSHVDHPLATGRSRGAAPKSTLFNGEYPFGYRNHYNTRFHGRHPFGEGVSGYRQRENNDWQVGSHLLTTGLEYWHIMVTQSSTYIKKKATAMHCNRASGNFCGATFARPNTTGIRFFPLPDALWRGRSGREEIILC